MADIQQDIYKRMEELLVEEKEYCDNGNYEHMAQMSVTSCSSATRPMPETAGRGRRASELPLFESECRIGP